MNIIMQVIEVLPPNASARERYNSIEQIVKHLQESMKYVEDQARFSIGFYRMQVCWQGISQKPIYPSFGWADYPLDWQKQRI